MLKLLYSFLLLPFFSLAQNTTDSGIRFENNLTWHQIKAKAQKEHKYIFMDCYASWCGPCKYMDTKIFPSLQVGDFMNAKFISVSVQMDSTGKDPVDIRKWYGEAHALEKEYQINAYPTYLFFSPEGQVLHKFIGATRTPSDFLDKVADALNPDKQYYTLVDHYKEHTGDSLFLRHTLVCTLKAEDTKLATGIMDLYLDCVKDPFRKDNVRLILASTTNVQSRSFQLILHSAACIDTALGINMATNFLIDLIKKMDIDPVLNRKDLSAGSWDSLQQHIKIDYPDLSDRILAQFQPEFYYHKQQWEAYGQALVQFMDKYQNQLLSLSAKEDAWSRINDYAWSAYLHCDDPDVLRRALDWSRQTINADSVFNPNYVDTYAQLQYKIGDLKDALIWTQKALNFEIAMTGKGVPFADVNVQFFKKRIGRMETGEKIWLKEK